MIKAKPIVPNAGRMSIKTRVSCHIMRERKFSAICMIPCFFLFLPNRLSTINNPLTLWLYQSLTFPLPEQREHFSPASLPVPSHLGQSRHSPFFSLGICSICKLLPFPFSFFKIMLLQHSEYQRVVLVNFVDPNQSACISFGYTSKDFEHGLCLQIFWANCHSTWQDPNPSPYQLVRVYDDTVRNRIICSIPIEQIGVYQVGHPIMSFDQTMQVPLLTH